MKLTRYIVNRIYFGGADKNTTPAVKIAIGGVALGITAMIIALAVVIGFKNQVAEKVIGFSSHVRITGITDNLTTNTTPVSVTDDICNTLLASPQVKSIGRCAEQPAVIKTNTDFAGVVLKGISHDYDTQFFANSLVEGTLPPLSDTATTNNIVISSQIASKMKLKTGESLLCYFINNNKVKARKFNISGIYTTNFAEYDNYYAICDLKVIQSVNNWESNQYGSLEIKLNDFKSLEPFAHNLRYTIMGNSDPYGVYYFVESALDINPQLFNWLDLLDMNVWIIIILMSLVAGFTIISGVLIIIMEKTSMIGTLKALGATNRMVKNTFIHLSAYIILKGVAAGNIIGLTLCFIQYQFGILKLDPATYYISQVPIEINWWLLLLLNIGSILLLLAMVTIPTHIISRIRPSETIRYE